MDVFNSWVDGHPWWVTLLLLPALVLAAVALRLARYTVLLGMVALVLVGALAVLSWRRRR